MSSPSADALIDALQLAATRMGIEPHAVTWSSVSGLTAATLASAFVLFRLIYHRPGKRVPPPPESRNGVVEKSKKAIERVHEAVKPEDGSVRVAQILIHPIKNDREWCFVDPAKNAIITAREFPKIVLITPRIEADPTDPHGGSIVVAFPPDAPEGCREFRIPLHPSPELLAEWQILDRLGLFSEFLDGYIGHALPLPSAYTPATENTASAISSLYFSKPVHLVYKGPRPRPAERTFTFPELDASTMFQDGYPLLLMSRESMGELDEEVRARVGTQGIDDHWKEDSVELRRFRPNVVVEGAGGFAEDAWEEVSFGTKEAPTVQLLPNISPESGVRDKAVPFKVLMKFRTGLDPIDKLKPCVGCNGVFTGSGVVSVGDVVYVKKMTARVDLDEA
ncbi:hypothetical protein C0991_007625 [Blastosporella zonata]|nr:hypothetical protein C0991_007625 [Blastosporella zonata]